MCHYKISIGQHHLGLYLPFFFFFNNLTPCAYNLKKKKKNISTAKGLYEALLQTAKDASIENTLMVDSGFFCFVLCLRFILFY